MAGKPSFEEALSKRKPANEEPKRPKRSRGGTSTLKPSRMGTKHIGGHFPPEVAKQATPTRRRRRHVPSEALRRSA